MVYVTPARALTALSSPDSDRTSGDTRPWDGRYAQPPPSANLSRGRGLVDDVARWRWPRHPRRHIAAVTKCSLIDIDTTTEEGPSTTKKKRCTSRTRIGRDTRENIRAFSEKKWEELRVRRAYYAYLSRACARACVRTFRARFRNSEIGFANHRERRSRTGAGARSAMLFRAIKGDRPFFSRGEWRSGFFIDLASSVEKLSTNR